jgi:hypothetical protein
MEKHFPGKNYDVVRTVEVETGGSRSIYEADTTSAEARPLQKRLIKTLGLGFFDQAAACASRCSIKKDDV